MADATTELETTARRIQARRENVMRERRGWYIAQGVLFILAGILAFVVPAATVWGVEMMGEPLIKSR